MRKKQKGRYYTLENILEFDAEYNVIYSGRSDGKTTAVLSYAIDDHIASGYENQLAIVRRWEEDFKGKNGSQMFSNIVSMGWIREKTKGRYNGVYYWAQRWYLCTYGEDGKRIDTEEEPFAMGFSISSEEHYKSTSYPKIKTIFFDEFITRGYYIQEEFVKFQNLLSTIIRLRTDVKIFMCGNTINKYNPYFGEMGLKNASKQQPGTIDIYTYGETGLKVAVEFAQVEGKLKEVNKYFAFDNPKLNMITEGAWEIDIYPHLPVKYTPSNVQYIFFIIFEGETLQGNVITVDDTTFIFIHRKTTPIKDDNKQLVYKQTIDYRRNYRRNIMRPFGKADRKIAELFVKERVFYQDNEVGEIVNNYMKWCYTNK